MRIATILTVFAAAGIAALAGPIIYVADFSDPHNYGLLDLGSGVFNPIGTVAAGEFLNGPGKSLYAIDESGNLLKVSASNGVTTTIGNLGFIADEPAGLADGSMYVSDVATHILYRIDPTSGLATAVGPTGFTDPANGFTIVTLVAGDTNNLYSIVESFDPNTQSIIAHAKLYQLDRASGAATFITDLDDDNAACAAIFSGTLYLFDYTGQIQTANLVTGATTQLYDLSAVLNGINGVAEVPVPEPSTCLMTGLGLVAATWIARRRRARRA